MLRGLARIIKTKWRKAARTWGTRNTWTVDEGEACTHPRPHVADEEMLRHKPSMFSTGFQMPGVSKPGEFFLLKATRQK